MYTILLYTNTKEQETAIIKNMLKDVKDIRIEELYPVGRLEYKHLKDLKILKWDIVDINIKYVDGILKETLNGEFDGISKSEKEVQIIIYGIDKGVSKVIRYISEIYPDVKIKLISNTYEGLIFYDYERKNFFKCLELLKENKIHKLYFLKKNIAEAYKNLGYNVSYLMQNYKVDSKLIEETSKIRNNLKSLLKENDNNVKIGVYKSNGFWNNNVYNTLSVAKFINNAVLRCNINILRDYEFINKQNINSNIVYFNQRDENKLVREIAKNDIVLDLDFTNNFTVVSLIAMQLKVPFLIGNNQDLFTDLEFKNSDLFVSNSEDNPLENSKKVMEILKNKNKEKLSEELFDWKKEYDKIQENNLNKMLND